MTRRTKYLGYRPAGTDKTTTYLSPSQPYTGDGKTTRQPHDKVRISAFAAIFGLKGKK